MVPEAPVSILKNIKQDMCPCGAQVSQERSTNYSGLLHEERMFDCGFYLRWEELRWDGKDEPKVVSKCCDDPDTVRHRTALGRLYDLVMILINDTAELSADERRALAESLDGPFRDRKASWYRSGPRKVRR
jgi:hypothetical protein